MYSEDDANRGFMSMAPPLKTCSRIGESCVVTKCCRQSRYDCYEKNATWASCLTQCNIFGFCQILESDFGTPVALCATHLFQYSIIYLLLWAQRIKEGKRCQNEELCVQSEGKTQNFDQLVTRACCVRVDLLKNEFLYCGWFGFQEEFCQVQGASRQ